MPKRMVERAFCDYPGCDNNSEVRQCPNCKNSFCLGHAVHIRIGTNWGYERCFDCTKEMYPCLSPKIDERIRDLGEIRKSGRILRESEPP